MKKYLLVAIAVASFGAMTANAYHMHYWKLIRKEAGYQGQTICEWMCKDALSGRQHFATTVGRSGHCSRPY